MRIIEYTTIVEGCAEAEALVSDTSLMDGSLRVRYCAFLMTGVPAPALALCWR